MPKASNFSNSVIKVFLKKGLKEEFESFGKKFESKLESLDRKFDSKLERFKDEIDENAKNYRDQILTKMGEVMSELETGRQERSLETNQYSGIVEQVDNHEKRIKKLEVQKTI